MSASSPGTAAPQPPQRVCPRCSSIARTVSAHCPFCGRSYTRRGPWAAIIAAVLVAVAATLAGVALMLTAFGDELDRQLDRSVEAVERDFGRDVRRLERRILREIDARLPPAPGG